MKVLIVSETLLMGGAEVFALRLTRALKNAGLNVELLSLNKSHEKKELTALFPDVVIHRIHLPFQFMIEKFDRIFLKLGIDISIKYFLQLRVIKKRFLEKYDIFHSNYLQVDHLFSKLKKYDTSFKHIVTVHGDYSAQFYHFKKNKKGEWLGLDKKLDLLKERVDQWILISDEQFSFFTKEIATPAHKIRKIYNGYMPNKSLSIQNRTLNITSSSFTIGMVSRGVKQKGWQILINAFLKLPDDCRLILVGEGGYLNEMKKKYAANKNIVFYGFHPNPVEMISLFDVFVLPTLYPYESLPTVLIEALYCNKPVIVTDVGETSQMITDDATGKKAGFLLDTEKGRIDYMALFEMLNYLYNNRDELKRLSETAKGAFEKFKMETCVTAYKEVYKQLLQ